MLSSGIVTSLASLARLLVSAGPVRAVGVLLTVALLDAAAARACLAQGPPGVRADSNLMYGVHSGLALLLDVHRPVQPNGLGVVVIPGIGWTSSMAYGTVPFNKAVGSSMYTRALLGAGFTVFAPSHRTTPAFTYPGPVEDVQRSVRFIKQNASRFGVRGDRLAGWGGSSGGYMMSMMGVLDGAGDPESNDPVERRSSKLSCVVAFSAPMDLVVPHTTVPELYSLFVGAPLVSARTEGSEENRRFREASPLTYVSNDDASFYLVHGDADEIVPFSQSERFATALEEKGRPAVLRRVMGGGHQLSRAAEAPQIAADAARWLADCLRQP